MDYVLARKITKEFSFNGKRFDPIIGNDWEYYWDGDKLKFKSPMNDFKGRIVSLITFTKDMLLSEDFIFNGNKLTGEYVFSSYGFINKGFFDEAIDFSLKNGIEYYHKEDFIEGKTYVTETGFEYLYLGGIDRYIIGNDNAIINHNQKNMFYSVNKETFIKFTKNLKLIIEKDSLDNIEKCKVHSSLYSQYIYSNLFNGAQLTDYEIDSFNFHGYLHSNKITTRDDKYYIRFLPQHIEFDIGELKEVPLIDNDMTSNFKEYYFEITNIHKFLRSLININFIYESKYIIKDTYFTGLDMVYHDRFKAKSFIR